MTVPKPWRTFRGWLLSSHLSMLAIILTLAIVLFGLLFSLLGETQERNSRYEIITTLSAQLNQSRLLFGQLTQDPNNRGDEDALQRFGFVNQELAITLHRLNIGSERDVERSFLQRGVTNGLTFINQELTTLLEYPEEVDSNEYFNRYWMVDRVYSYLESYAFYRYLPLAVKSDVSWMAQTQRRILTYRTLIILLFLFIATLFSTLIYILTMRLVNPVEKMVDTAEQIFHGNFDGEEIAISGPLELQYLEASMNQMRQSLKERLAIMEQNAELEKRVHDQELARVRTTRELEKARYNALQSQINPHFLFNTLNTIGRTALFEDAPSTVDLIDNLAAIFRYTLNHDEDVTLGEELQFVKEYLTIQHYRFKERLTFSINVPEELIDLRIPPLVIQPLVENAMIHGLEPLIEGGTILIEALKRGRKAEITITDSGVGIDLSILKAVKKRESGHIGIENIERRLKHYFNERSTLEFTRLNEEGGTEVKLLIPIQKGGKKRVHALDR